MGEQSEPEEAAQDMAFKQVLTNFYLISIFQHFGTNHFEFFLFIRKKKNIGNHFKPLCHIEKHTFFRYPDFDIFKVHCDAHV